MKCPFQKIAYWVACGGGVGLSPYAPGTVGSLLAVVLYLVFIPLPFWLCAILWLCLTGIATVCIHISLPCFQSDDPRAVVIDEVCGGLLAFLALPHGLLWVVVAFALFRFFDIVKPGPIAYVDRHVKGAVGIMLDDILAGISALAVIQILVLGLDYFSYAS